MEDLKRKRYECGDCSYKTNKREDLFRHHRKHTGEKPFDCGICGKSFSNQSTCNRHVLIHSGERRYKCDQCSSRFTERYSLQKHIRLHTGENLFVCSLCDKKYATKSKFENHVRSHTGEKPFKCPLCEKRFSSKDSLNSHVRCHNKWNCTQCDINFLTYVEFHRHRKTHLKNTKWDCRICGKNFSTMHYLVIHMQTHPGEKPFQCPFCNKKYQQKLSLDRHTCSAVHLKEKSFSCSKCKNSFASKSELGHHMEEHDKIYSCSHCDKRYRKETTLKDHLRIHPDEPSQCHDRKVTFSSNQDLRSHMQQHKSVMNPYQCPFCDTKLISKCVLLKHLEKHHSNSLECDLGLPDGGSGKSFKCSICEKHFSSAKSLALHEAIEHNFVKQQGVSNSPFDTPEEDGLDHCERNKIYILEESDSIDTPDDKALVEKDDSSDFGYSEKAEDPFSDITSTTESDILIKEEVFECLVKEEPYDYS